MMTMLAGSKLLKVSAAMASLGLVTYQYDKQYNASALTRNLRTAAAGCQIAYLYKLKYNEKADIDAIHQQAADIIYNVCSANGGLYVKFGQGLCSFNHILPPAFTETLKPLFMDAPAVSFDEVVEMFK